jgi:hypothetical protein
LPWIIKKWQRVIMTRICSKMLGVMTTLAQSGYRQILAVSDPEQWFPYPVRWDDIDFNQVVTVHTAFEESTAQVFEELLHPLPKQVQTWRGETDLNEWRRSVQSRRKIRDSEFFKAFLSDAPPSLLSV